MAKRIPLSQRLLPNYTRGEELMNMITHIVGGGFGVLALVLGLVRTVPGAAPLPILGVLIYGLSLIALYTVSSVYHGLHPGMGKKVMQVIDHCTIYALIAAPTPRFSSAPSCPRIPPWAGAFWPWSGFWPLSPAPSPPSTCGSSGCSP